MSTCNELCYLELRMASLKALAMQKQRKLFKNMWRDRSSMVDDPWVHSGKLILTANTPTSKYVSDLLTCDKDDIKKAIELIKQSMSASNSSHRMMYISLNSSFDVCDVYCKRLYVNDTQRVSFTRLRVGAHSLAIETSRWNRRGRRRLPLEEQLCPCGQVQTELHVVESCLCTQQIRNLYKFDSWQQLMSKNVKVLVITAYLILEK